jgi:zinc transport system substrate-binding protein
MRPAAALLFVVLVLAGCGGNDSSSEREIVAAFYPLAWVAEQVAGDDVEVVNLTPPGAEPHDLELSARDVERVHEAAVVLYLGRFMPALDDAVEDHENAVDLLGREALRVVTDAHGHEGEDAGGPQLDPHVWLDPQRLAGLAREIATAFGDAEAADDVVAELERLDEEYRAGLADCERREIVTSHAAFGYLADAYDLEQIALTGISPEAEPSPRALEELVDEVREHDATTVFFETLVSPRLAETVAREAGAETAALDPVEGLSEEALDDGADYLSVMRENLEVLRDALGCR